MGLRGLLEGLRCLLKGLRGLLEGSGDWGGGWGVLEVSWIC